MGLHPHGLICSPLWLHVLPEGAFRARHGLEFRMATIRFNFWIPVWTDVLVALGFIVASRSSIEDNLRAGIAVGLVVGGAEEAAAMAVDRFDLVLRKCKGFIKCALRAGAPVAPVVTLGENKIIRQELLPPGHRLGAITRALFPFCQRHLGFVPIVPYGRPFFGGLVPASVVPFQSRFVTVVGKPLPMPEISEPTQEELDHHHEKKPGRGKPHLQHLQEPVRPGRLPAPAHRRVTRAERPRQRSRLDGQVVRTGIRTYMYSASS